MYILKDIRNMENNTEEKLTVQDLAMFIGCDVQTTKGIGSLIEIVLNKSFCCKVDYRGHNNKGYTDPNGVEYGFIYLEEDLPVPIIKPILRPLSDMTEEEGLEIAKLVSYRLQRGMPPLNFKFIKGNKACDKILVNWDGNSDYVRYTISITNDGVCYSDKAGHLHDRDFYTPNQYKLTQYLISKQFDVFGWIEKGLAIKK